MLADIEIWVSGVSRPICLDGSSVLAELLKLRDSSLR